MTAKLTLTLTSTRGHEVSGVLFPYGATNWFQCDLSHCHVTPNFSGPEGGSIDRMRLAAVKVKSRFDQVMTDV